MTLSEFIDEYNNFTPGRKRIGRIKFLEQLIDQNEEQEDFIFDMMLDARDIEADDGFGTEGMDI